jgi:hypothetical protein
MRRSDRILRFELSNGAPQKRASANRPRHLRAHPERRRPDDGFHESHLVVGGVGREAAPNLAPAVGAVDILDTKQESRASGNGPERRLDYLPDLRPIKEGLDTSDVDGHGSLLTCLGGDLRWIQVVTLANHIARSETSSSATT